MRSLYWFSPLVLAVPFVLLGCGQSAPTQAAKEYDIKGKVVNIADDKKALTLDHEDIPGLMRGMQMKFDVEDAKVLEGIKAGDQVHGRLKVDNGKYVITRLEKH